MFTNYFYNYQEQRKKNRIKDISTTIKDSINNKYST